MRTRRIIFLIAVMAALAAAPTWAAADRAQGGFERTLKVSGTPTIDVNTGSGGITVRPGDGSTVRIVAKIFANDDRHSGMDAEAKVREIEANPPIEQTGNTIRIGRVPDEKRDLYRNVGISYELTVPTESRMDANTGSGSIDIADVRGPVDANTGSGGVRLYRTGGDLRANTGSGSVEVDSTGGSVRASTGSGSIRIGGLTGMLRASTGSGSIRVQGKQGGDWQLSTGSGGVDVQLPTDAGFELDAETGSGGIHTAHPITLVGSIRRDAMRGTVRGGGPKLSIRTGSGTIRIE